MTRIGGGDRAVMQSVAGVSERIATVWAIQTRQKPSSPSPVRESRGRRGPGGSRQRFAVADRPRTIVVRKKGPGLETHHSTPSKRNLAIYGSRNKHYNKCTLATKSNRLWSVGSSRCGRVDDEGLNRSIESGAAKCRAVSRTQDWGLIALAELGGVFLGAMWCSHSR
jgi:hypothetical protein